MKAKALFSILAQSMLKMHVAFGVIIKDLAKSDDAEITEGHLKIIKDIGEELVRMKQITDNILTKKELAYFIVIDIFGNRQLVEASCKEAAIELANSFHGDDGKAFIFTNDLTVGGREERVGGTIICESPEDAEKKSFDMVDKK